MKKIKYLFFLLLLATFVITALFIFISKNNKSIDKYNINTDSAAVVTKLQSLNRFETASFSIEKIIDAGTANSDLKEFLFGDSLLLIAHGNVIAGFDLSKIGEDNFLIENEKITINLPNAQILLSKLDNDKTRVYDRRQGLLTRGDKDLESEARLAAEKSIISAACDEGILVEAAKNGRNQLSALFKALGFTTVIINIPDSSC